MKIKKHVFLVNHSCPFIINLLLNLVHKEVLLKEDILIATFEMASNRSLIESRCKQLGFETCDWKELIRSTNFTFLSLNPMSLNSFNANIITGFLEAGLINEEDINIILTDDEVDRWHLQYKKEGNLKVSKKAFVDADVIKILNLNLRFLCPGSLGNTLKIILGEQINIVNVNLPFTLFDYKKQSAIEELFNLKQHDFNSSRKRVMLHTKSTSLSRSFSLPFRVLYYFLFIHKKDNTAIEIGIWTGLTSIYLVFFQFVLFVIVYVKKIDLKINLLYTMPIERYFFTLYEYDNLILQRRGGFSTATYFAEKIGRVIVEKDTENHHCFKDYSFEPLTCNSFFSALDAALNNGINIEDYKGDPSAFSKRINESVLTLKDLFGSKY